MSEYDFWSHQQQLIKSFVTGDWVTVKPEYDIPLMFRPDGKPTRGRVERVEDDYVEIWVPIGDADVDEHSQSVSYEPHMLVLDEDSER